MVNHACIVGRSHRLNQKNCQDFAISAVPRPGTSFGIVLDGCGGKFHDGRIAHQSHNEIGAKLLGQYAAGWLREQLTNLKTPLSENGLFTAFYHACLDFLAEIVKFFPFQTTVEKRCFIATHLLTTIVGFIITPETAVFFWKGDGLLCLNGEITVLDSGNRPDYLAYGLLDQGSAGRANSGEQIFSPHLFPCSRAIFSYQIIDHTSLDWLAVATDGWRPELMTDFAKPAGNIALQRLLNVLARQPGSFEDDGAVAVWHREISS
jgi:hypothetical protein